MSLLNVSDLQVTFDGVQGEAKAVKGVSFSLEKGQILGIVGESGSGKSVTSMAVMGLLDRRRVKISGSVTFEGKDLLQMSEKEICKIRGKEINMIFQDPMSSLDPVMNIYSQLKEVFDIHSPGSKKEDHRTEMCALLKKLHVHNPGDLLKKYPFELSGGLKQRVMIAMALLTHPKVIIADEPTTALDVTTQKGILRLIKDIRDQLGTSVIFISHDLSVVSEIADRIAVMYYGQIVEECDADLFFKNPLHPYARALLNAMPDQFDGRFNSIEGCVPDIYEKIQGCPFTARCQYADQNCRTSSPSFQEVEENHFVRCHHIVE